MNITADTNVLVRVLVHDDKHQAEAADRLLRNASQIVVPPAVFCELVWVLSRSYGRSHADILGAIELLLNVQNLVTNRPAIENGIALQKAGGDFADGVIAYEGKRLGGDVFVSFDKKATSLLKKAGFAVQLAK